jgi:hypothetical protein
MRCEILLGFVVIDYWDTELIEMNKDKVGEPFRYPNTFLLLLGYAKVYLHIQYKVLSTLRRIDGHQNVVNFRRMEKKIKNYPKDFLYLLFASSLLYIKYHCLNQNSKNLP